MLPDIKVFISYAHDSAVHKKNVESLKAQLLSDGLGCTFDGDIHVPPEGWPLWCENQIENSDYVFIVCTETYFRRFQHTEEPDKGQGVKWEGHIIRQLIYDDGASNKKYIPIIFNEEDIKYIPISLKSTTHYNPLDKDIYDKLLARLTEQPLTSFPEKGKIPVIVPRTIKPLFSNLDQVETIDLNSSKDDKKTTGLDNDLEKVDISIKLKDIEEDFRFCKKDRIGKTRRNSIKRLSETLEKISPENNTFDTVELKTKIWHQLILEARTVADYLSANKMTEKYLYLMYECAATIQQKFIAIQIFVEWAVDSSQSSKSVTRLDKITSRLRKAITFLGQQIKPTITKNQECAILCMRAKCRRALASLLQRRGGGGEKLKRDIDKHKYIALQDAERGFEAYQYNSSKFELALCLFANSSTVKNKNSIRGMSLLREAYDDGHHILAGYELVKQLRIRHEYEQAVSIFRNIAERDVDIRRFYLNVTNFAASVIGMYYDNVEQSILIENASLAYRWLEELISQEYHRAIDIVDYCFIKLILDFSIEDQLKVLESLKPTSTTMWNELAEMVVSLSKGDDNVLVEALLLGIDEPYVWNRIGTIYSDFVNDQHKAIEFYNRASMIDYRSPVFHFNKARILAYKLRDYQNAKIALISARSLIKNNYGWYECNKVSLKKLESKIREGILTTKLLQQADSIVG